MNKSTLNYFHHRIKELSTQDDRTQLGEREIITLLTALGITDGSSSLKKKSVIDLGSGDQHLKKSLEFRGATYRGLDISECDLEFDPFPVEDETYDIAIGLSIIEHLSDPSHFLFETKRILKKGGVLWMDTPDIEACGALFYNDPTHVHPYTRKSFKIVLEMHGFTEVLITPNYRCKSRWHYQNTKFNFFRARYLMPFAGISSIPVPDFLKGKCTGLFALATKG